MEHGYLDKYSQEKHFLQLLDPRVKIVFLLSLLVMVAAGKPSNWFFLLFTLAVLSILALLSKLPFKFMLLKSIYFLPFTLMLTIMAYFNPNIPKDISRETYVLVLTLKSWLGFLITIILISTTPFQDLLKGLQKFGLPKFVIFLFSFTYRYFFVLFDEFTRMVRAAKCRSAKPNLFVIAGNFIGMLFVRTYERADRIYQAMLSKGFSGEIRTYNELKLTDRDKGFLLISIGGLIIIGLLIF